MVELSSPISCMDLGFLHLGYPKAILSDRQKKKPFFGLAPYHPQMCTVLHQSFLQ